MKFAIIGAGISGNVIARLLCVDHDLTVFEPEHRLGGHTRTLNVRAFDRDYCVDTGFMVYNERTYPNFCRILRLLGIEGQNADMSFGVRCAATSLEYQGNSLNGLFAQRRNLFRPEFHRMLWDILRFHRDAPALLESGLTGLCVNDLLKRARYGDWFWSKYLVPMAAAIWSCPPAEVAQFPAHFLLGFFRNHGLLQVNDRPQWKTIRQGARTYVERLSAPYRDRVRRTAIESVWRQEDHVIVQARGAAAEIFDGVIFACHADQALALLKDPDENEWDLLSAFPYQRNTALLHTDISLLPTRPRAWASWNYYLPTAEAQPATLTYDLSRLQQLDSPAPILLTLNPGDRIDPRTVIDQHVFHHPVFSKRSLEAQSRFSEINGKRRTYFCGAYTGYGFHEDGVNSALRVAKYFNASLESWKAASTKGSFITSV